MPRKQPPALILLLAAVTASPFMPAARAQAQVGDITYNVDETVGSGSVVGQIVTNGATGVLSQADIVSWNLTLNGVGASTALTSTGGQSGLQVVGSDLTASGKNLLFNYSGTDSGYLLFQAANPGFYSGQKYYCLNTTWYGCEHGASVVPGTYTDPSAQFAALSGNQIIGTAGSLPPLDALYQSIQALTRARASQALISQLEYELLLGLDEQISCGNCGGADANFGSEALSGHGRYALTPEWTVFGGTDLGQYDEKGADVKLNVGVAAAIQYDPASLGPSRPYATAGVAVSVQDIRYSRTYGDASGTYTGSGSTHGHDISAFVQTGWVDRITPRDEAAAYLSYTRTWQIIGGYSEAAGDGNPLNAGVPGGTDTLDTAGVNAQYTHLFWGSLEANLNAGAEWVFKIHSGLIADVAGMEIQGSQPAFVYYEVGGRLGIRLPHRVTLDLFVNGILAPSAIGRSTHGGFGGRWAF